MMNLEDDFFTLFGLPKSYSVDMNALSSAYRELQKQWHPDRFASGSEREQRIAAQYTTHLNEASATLKSPLLRAQYLLALAGRETRNESGGRPLPGTFLMQQMMLREQLSEVSASSDPEGELDSLRDQADQLLKDEQQAFVAALNDDALDAAEDAVHKMQFITKLQREIDELEERLFDD